jgi:hypothetical protein
LRQRHVASRQGEEPFTITGRLVNAAMRCAQRRHERERAMNGLIYLIGLIVVIMAILSFFGLR